MSHPCADHPCDHCYRCDVLGECCMTASGGIPVQLTATPNKGDGLREAIAAGQSAPANLADLVRKAGNRRDRSEPAMPDPAAEEAGPASRSLGELLAHRPERPALPSASRSITDLLTQHQTRDREEQHHGITRPVE